MKKSFINNMPAWLLLALMVVSCDNSDSQSHHDDGNSAHAVDSTVLQLAKTSGSEVMSNVSTVDATTGTRIISLTLPGIVSYDSRRRKVISSRVAGRIEQLSINYNFQKVEKGQKLLEVYSPDLAAAQRELIFLQQSGDEVLFQKAKMRLQLLGMANRDIDRVLNTKQVLYRVPVYSNTSGYIVESTTRGSNTASPVQPTSGEMGEMPSPSRSFAPGESTESNATKELTLREGQYIDAGAPLFSIYTSDNLFAEFSVSPEMANKIKHGQKILFYPQHQQTNIVVGKVGLMEPVLRSGQQFSVLRVYLEEKEYQVGELLVAKVPVIFSGGWWLPTKAVWTSGSKHLVFQKTGGVFVPREVAVKATLDESVLVATDISDWQVASNAAYLADSEAFIFSDKNPGRYEE